MSPVQPSYPTTLGPEYSNIAETQGKYFKTNSLKMIEVFNKEINESLIEIQENINKQLEKVNKSPKGNQENKSKPLFCMNKTAQDLKIKIEIIIKNMFSEFRK